MKGQASRLLRVLALCSASAGAVIPLVTIAATGEEAGGWGYAFLASAAAIYGFDRFFGLSTGWMRYMSTALRLQERLATFQIEWMALEATRTTDPPGHADVQEALRLLATFLRQVHDIINNETSTWMAEFESALADLDRQASSTSPP